jgi:hypothetical protein
MIYPFRSPKLKLARAREHILDLNQRIDGFFEPGPWLVTVEEKGKETHFHIKIREPLPEHFNGVAADVISNLRAVLDQSVCASVRALGNDDVSKTYFPFGPDLQNLEREIIRKTRDVAPEIVGLIRSFEPHKNGNPELWALNRLCTTDKHQITVPATIHGRLPDGDQRRATFSWSAESATLSCVVEHEDGPAISISFILVFDGIEAIAGKPLARLLEDLASVCERILVGIEAETNRLLRKG